MCTPPFFFEDYAARALLSHPVSELPERTRPLAQRTLPHQHLPRPPVLRGIYFPMLGRMAWLKIVAENRHTIFKLVDEALFGRRTRRRKSRCPRLV
jgi:hypothetical protein